MSVEAVYLLRKDDPTSGLLRELDDVVLLEPATTSEGETIPAGTEGTIVTVWGGGGAYKVEFAEPEGALATVEPQVLRLAGSRVP